MAYSRVLVISYVLILGCVGFLWLATAHAVQPPGSSCDAANNNCSIQCTIYEGDCMTGSCSGNPSTCGCFPVPNGPDPGAGGQFGYTCCDGSLIAPGAASTCNTPSTTYACNSGGGCIAQTGGPYTTANCNNACVPPPIGPANLPDFGVQVQSPRIHNITAGASTNDSVYINETNPDYATDTVNLSVSGCPPGATCSINPNAVTTEPQTVAMGIQTTANTPAGEYYVYAVGSDPYSHSHQDYSDLRVAAGPRSPHIDINQTSFTFNAVSGGSPPSSQNFVLTNIGGGTFNWSASPSQGWCHVSPASGSLTAGNGINVSMSVDAPSNPSPFPPCTITVSAANADDSPATVTVNYSVAWATCPAGSVSVNPSSIPVGGTATASAPANGYFTNGGFASTNGNASVSGASGSTVTGVSAGQGSIVGNANWDYFDGNRTHAHNCSLNAAPITVTAPARAILSVSGSPSFSATSGGTAPAPQGLPLQMPATRPSPGRRQPTRAGAR